MTDDDGSFDDGLGLDRFELTAPIPRKYDGWHLPRKQVVRHAQWAQPLNDVLSGRREDPRVVKYLGLPGRDLLDVRHILETVCIPFGRTLYFLGFDRTADATDDENVLLNSAYSDILRAPNVDGTSVVMSDDIGRLANLKSQAFNKAKNRAPFDVVNLDFCEPVLGGGSTLYRLLDRLFKLQKSQDEWLLLLTSRVENVSFQDESLDLLLPLLEQNRNNCEGFETALAEYLDLPSVLVKEGVRDLSGPDFFTLASVLFGKWFLRESMKAGFQLKVSSCGYAVHGGADMDMLSLSIRMKPMHSTGGDDAGFVPADDVDECAHAETMVRGMAAIQNVDRYLESDRDVEKRFVRDSIVLMESANHPAGPYREFLRAKGFSIP